MATRRDKPTAFQQHDWICSIVLRKKKREKETASPNEKLEKIAFPLEQGFRLRGYSGVYNFQKGLTNAREK